MVGVSQTVLVFALFHVFASQANVDVVFAFLDLNCRTGSGTAVASSYT